MPVTHESTEVAQLRHLLCRLETTQNGAVAVSQVDARASHVDGWLDWIRGPGFGTTWYTELALQCHTLVVTSDDEGFKNASDDFRPNLKAFLDLCPDVKRQTRPQEMRFGKWTDETRVDEEKGHESHVFKYDGKDMGPGTEREKALPDEERCEKERELGREEEEREFEKAVVQGGSLAWSGWRRRRSGRGGPEWCGRTQTWRGGACTR